MAKDLVCNMEVDEKTASTKQSTKANTTTSALQDAKKPSKQTHKNTSAATRQVTAAVAVTTTAKPLRFDFLHPFLFLCFLAQQNYSLPSFLTHYYQ